MEALHIYIGLAALSGLFMAWGTGANEIPAGAILAILFFFTFRAVLP